MSSKDKHTEEAGPPTAGRLLIPVGLKPAAVRASRIDAPIRRLSGATMGTGWSLSYAAPDTIENARVVSALEDIFARTIQQMSNWEPASDLSRFNRTPGWHELKPDFFKVLTRALEIAALTDGAYDPTLGATVDKLGFGPSSLSAHPSESRDSEPHAGWRDIQLDPTNQRAFQPGGASVDLSSIAKGYAVDLCAQALRDLLIPSFLMEIGGEFAGEGVKPDAQPWWVQLELSDIAPAPTEPPHTDIALVNLAVATSGDFGRRRDGVSHLLDGRTGAPVANGLSGVAVMHASCMDADGWATALYALGERDGLAMADAQDLAAIFCTRRSEGAHSSLSTRAQSMLG